MHVITSKLKLFSLFVALIVITLILGFVLKHAFFEESTKKVALENAREKTKERESVFKSFLFDASNTLSAIRTSDAFENYLSAQTDMDDINDLFMTFAKDHANIMQLRYINREGK